VNLFNIHYRYSFSIRISRIINRQKLRIFNNQQIPNWQSVWTPRAYFKGLNASGDIQAMRTND